MSIGAVLDGIDNIVELVHELGIWSLVFYAMWPYLC